ncbi:MAG: hypothetical protein ACUVS7_05275 [Bryobacteraceae bacterium]
MLPAGGAALAMLWLKEFDPASGLLCLPCPASVPQGTSRRGCGSARARHALLLGRVDGAGRLNVLWEVGTEVQAVWHAWRRIRQQRGGEEV